MCGVRNTCPSPSHPPVGNRTGSAVLCAQRRAYPASERLRSRIEWRACTTDFSPRGGISRFDAALNFPVSF